MKNKTTTITLIALLALGSFGLLFTTLLTPAAAAPVDLSTAGPYAMDATPEMLGDDEVAIREYAAEVGSAIATGASPTGDPAEVGDEITFDVSDSGKNIDYEETFVVVMDGTHGIILLSEDIYDNYDPVEDEYVSINPEWPDGGYNPEDIITTAQLGYLLDQFDNVIYPTEMLIYGEPLPRGAEGKKVWILIHNIRDEAYYDGSINVYTGGYFSAGENAAQNMNMFHIDTNDWANRVGPDGTRPYLYEGTLAHEFEHMIHFDIDPDEPSWVDEGLADMASFFCGYGHSESHVAYYIFYHPVTALTFWGSGLEDYGASYLFQLYLYEKFGGAAFTSALVQEQDNGIEGIENTLAAFGYSETFDEIFDAWTIANYIDDPRKDGGKYGYELIDIGSVDSWGYTIEYACMYAWWGPADMAPYDESSYWLGDPQPYTAHYYRFNNKRATDFYFDGEDFSGTLAYSGSYEWYSDAGAWAWRSFYQRFDIPAGGATLDFYTFYQIEGDWDYGYVEVYDKDTGEWYTLDAPGTVDYVAHVQPNDNTPDHREPSAYETAGRWHAFTGDSGGWVPVSMDLTPFAGHEIDLYFTTWQDGAFTLQMMYVDDISIPEIGFFDDVEAGEDGWASTGWYRTDGIQDNGWSVTVIDTKGVLTERYPEYPGNNAMTLHSMSTMVMDFATQSGYLGVSATPVKSGRVKVAIVSNHANHILPAGYIFGVY